MNLVLASLAPAALHAFDLSGRRIRQQPLDVTQGREQSTRLRLPPLIALGIYQLVLTQGMRRVSERLTILR